MNKFPKKVKPGEQISARQWNLMVDRLRECHNLTVSAPLEMKTVAAVGRTLSLSYLEQEALVELTEALHRGSSAEAGMLWEQGGAFSTAATAYITVHDVLGIFENQIGDRLLVKWNRQAGKWIVWQGDCG